MVSRRSVRIKVMQLLYSQNRDEELNKRELLKRYDDSIDQSFELLLFALYLFINVAYEAVEHEKKNRTKLMPTEEDSTFTAKLYTNSLIQSLAENAQLEKTFAKKGFGKKADQDFFKKMYSQFSKTPEYVKYISSESTDENHLDILLELFRFLRKDEFFNEVIDDHYSNWQDDKSLVVGAMKKILKQLPADGDFFKEYAPDKETALDFGKALLENVCDHDEELVALIEPTLKNWDADRLAIMDMIMLKMGLVEFMYFKTIPTKVTLNEYVEISKMYSTPKSKDFVNGILDRQMKMLEAEGKINKLGRGLVN